MPPIQQVASQSPPPASSPASPAPAQKEKPAESAPASTKGVTMLSPMAGISKSIPQLHSMVSYPFRSLFIFENEIFQK